MNNCPVCGSNVAPGENFCKACGTKMPSPQTNVVNNNAQNLTVNQEFAQQMNDLGIPTGGYQAPIHNVVTNNVTQNDYIDDNYLVDAYIGKNQDKLKNGGWSWCSFLFGNLYFFYRKMWLLAGIWYAISIVGNLFLSSLSGIIGIALDIVGAIKFKEWYLKHANEQVDKIKRENPGKTQEELAAICKKKGGTTVWPVIIFVILYIGLLIFTEIPEIKEIIDENSSGYSTENYLDTNTDTKTKTTDGNGVIGNLNVTVPSIFEESNYSGDTYKMYHVKDYSFDYDCDLNLTTYNVGGLYSDAKTYLEKHIYYTASDEFSGISDYEINGLTWNHATVTSTYNNEDYYGIDKDGKIYIIEFKMNKRDNGTCAKAHETIINSVRFN